MSDYSMLRPENAQAEDASFCPLSYRWYNISMIRECRAEDADTIYAIINKSAKAYEGVIPADRYHQPYMPMSELKREMARITFFGWKTSGQLVGVMGTEPVRDVILIRHAYILPAWQNQGIGSRLLEHLMKRVTTARLLVGTWADARWAIEFYQKHGFKLVSNKDELLLSYWDVPPRQIETSVVLGIDTGNGR